MSNCSVCNSPKFEEIDWTRSNVAVGNFVGVSEKTIRTHKKNCLAPKMRVRRAWETFHEGQIVTLKSYEVDHSEQVKFLRADDLSDQIDNWESPTEPVAFYTGRPIIVCGADFQIGKADQRKGGTPETIDRILESLHAVVQEIRALRPREIIFADLGDIIENIFNTPKQVATNDMDLPEQIRTARRLVLKILKTLYNLSPKLTYVAVPSNHGNARVGMKNEVWSPEADWGLEIFEQVKDVLEEANYTVGFVRPKKYEEIAEYTTGNTRIAFAHMHQAKRQENLHKWWSAIDHGRLPGWNADLFVGGHYHNFSVQQSGNERWIITAPTSDAGSDWYRIQSGQESTTGILTFTVEDGMWYSLKIC